MTRTKSPTSNTAAELAAVVETMFRTRESIRELLTDLHPGCVLEAIPPEDVSYFRELLITAMHTLAMVGSSIHCEMPIWLRGQSRSKGSQQ